MWKICIAIRNDFKDIFAGFCCFRDFSQFTTCSLQAMKFSTTFHQGLYLMKDVMYTIFYIDKFYSSHILTLPLIKGFTVKFTKPHLVTPNVVTMPVFPL